MQTRTPGKITKDNPTQNIISLDICQTGIIFLFLYAHPQVIYYNCGMFQSVPVHPFRWSFGSKTSHYLTKIHVVKLSISYIINYLPCNCSDLECPPLCTSSGSLRFHQYWLIHLGVALTGNMDGQTDRFIYPLT